MHNHYRQLPDETAGSILFRLAQKECQPVADLAKELFGLSYQQARSDLDQLLPSRHNFLLVRALRLATPTAVSFSLPRAWTVSVWNTVSKQYDGPIRLCGACLKKSLHGQRYWRTLFAAACPDHGIDLIDACPTCGAAIPYFGSPSGFISQLWLEAWPTCPACFHPLNSDSQPANPVLVAMSTRWRNALDGRPQLGFTAAAFLKLSARAIHRFQHQETFIETARLVAGDSRWRGHTAAALMIRSLCRRRVPLNVCYAALGMVHSPSQLAKDIVS